MIETFGSLLRDRAHWEFELLVGFLEMLVFDGIIFGLFWPFIRKHWQHHIDRDQTDACDREYPKIKLGEEFSIPAGATIQGLRVDIPEYTDWPGHVKSPEGWDG
jgi:hypothetical protein